jgi:hypothetical protein
VRYTRSGLHDVLYRLTLARFADVGSERKLPGWQNRQPPVHPFHAQKHRLCGANSLILHSYIRDCKNNFQNFCDILRNIRDSYSLRVFPAIGRGLAKSIACGGFRKIAFYLSKNQRFLRSFAA